VVQKKEVTMSTNLILLVIVLLILTVVFPGCENPSESKTNLIIKDHFNGYVQKGPFINGSSISIYELEENLSQTGKVYNTQIIDNSGSFTLNDITLISNYANIRADGFYFNEILGEQSTSQITLYVLSDVSDKNILNVNILTYLEQARVKYLVSNGSSFNDAKNQAELEILSIFSIENEVTNTFENLDIAVHGDDNAILLAISLILQGFHTEGELTEFISNISNDIRADGILNNTTLGSELINHTVYLDTITIRNNLENRYSDLGIQFEIPHFEKYINNFITNTSFEITKSIIEYPSTGLFGKNLLALNDTIYNGLDFSLAANLPKGTSLRVSIIPQDSSLRIAFSVEMINWTYLGNHTFKAIESGESCDLEIALLDPGQYLISYYEIESSGIPTRIKRITKN
jgi:hypothetical protein